MSDYITKTLLTGLGLASLTKDAVQKLGKELAQRSNLSEKEGRRLIKDLERRSAEASRALEKKVNAAVHKVVRGLNLATRADLHKAAKTRRAKRTAKRASRGHHKPSSSETNHPTTT